MDNLGYDLPGNRLFHPPRKLKSGLVKVLGRHLRRQLGGFAVPCRKFAGYVQQIGWRQPGALDDLLVHQLIDDELNWRHCPHGLQQVRQALRSVSQQLQHTACFFISHRAARLSAQHPVLQPVGVAYPLRRERPGAQIIEHLWKGMAQISQGDDPFRSDSQVSPVIEVHPAVAAQSDRAGVHGAHARPVRPHSGSLFSNLHPAGRNHRNIGRCPTHIHNDSRFNPRQELPPDGAGRRAGVNDLHRTLARKRQAGERAIAAHHHDRALHAAANQKGLYRLQEILRRIEQRCIQAGGGSPAD